MALFWGATNIIIVRGKKYLQLLLVFNKIPSNVGKTYIDFCYISSISLHRNVSYMKIIPNKWNVWSPFFRFWEVHFSARSDVFFTESEKYQSSPIAHLGEAPFLREWPSCRTSASHPNGQRHPPRQPWVPKSWPKELTTTQNPTNTVENLQLRDLQKVWQPQQFARVYYSVLHSVSESPPRCPTWLTGCRPK